MPALTNDTVDAFKYAMSAIAINAKYREMELNNYLKRKSEMGCRNFAEEMRALQRCGCNECYDKMRRLEENYRRSRYDYYYNGPRLMATPIPYLSGEFETKETKVEKVEEPKNYAVKLLVDQLKAQQSGLEVKKKSIESDKGTIKTYQNYLKTKNAEKLAIENKIKELSVALKKLGHKE